MAFVQGYTVFMPGKWDVPNFLFSYAMLGIVPALFIGWKFIHKTPVRRLFPTRVAAVLTLCDSGIR